ncbi:MULTISPECIES: Gfo/Idh/MocA family protein [unclassified Pedobacter]|uniref:Gfo/Idh/MocA family protein n=1 Tax=unclassified Pedobacter TaxID=2628915 RepID=UPI001E15CF66|nr:MULTISPECIES: Gfo/Idh/MocA family oxidoreductase [unclassified Pedobacter]CAH0257511.1 Inositol 2-dehydrogenase [Pedobacter sp. Bi36]CAH0284708.1 Inositol 2-dehydrogenase [Pedobacter sp. Bi126]
MQRRSFVKTSALLGSGLLLGNQGFANLVADEIINVAMIGCGDRGKGVLSVIKSMPAKYKIKAYCDLLDFRLKETEKYVPADAKAIKDYHKVLDDKTINAVFIATPLSEHFRIAKDAVLAGKHVYVEKTMTYNIAQALELKKLVKQYPNQVFQVGYQYRYSPLYFKVKDMIQSGYLGKVSQIDCRWDRNGNWRRAVPDPALERKINWRMYKEYSGGLAAELLSHQIDFINWAFETQPDEIMGSGGIDVFKDGRETYDNIQAILRYNEKGMIGNFGATCGNAHDGYLFKIKGTKGSVSLLTNTGLFYPEESAKKKLGIVDGVTGATKIVVNKDGGIPILDKATIDGTNYALDEFYKSITTKKEPVSNINTGTQAAICVAMCNEAIYSGNKQVWKTEYSV